MGVLFGVGVGPGDPELITLKAVKCIKEADVVAIPAATKEKCTAYNIIKDVVEGIDDKEILPCAIPMVSDRKLLDEAYDKIAADIAIVLDSGKNVAFVNIGDPVLYGTYMQLHERLSNKGYEIIIINGVTSVSAVAAKLSVPLGYRKDSIHIVPGFYTFSDDSRSFEDEVRDYLSKGDTVVVMKSGKEFSKIIEFCKVLQKTKIAKAMAVVNCSMSDERIISDIDSLEDTPGYFTTIIIKPL